MSNSILLIGGSGYLGQALHDRLKEDGYNPLIFDKKKPGFDHDWFFQGDATNEGDLKAAALEIAQNTNPNRPLRHIFNTVGGLVEHGLTDMSLSTADQIRRSIEQNLLSQIMPVHVFQELLKQAEGDKSFVLTSSINAHNGWSIPFYTAAKGGLVPFARTAAMDLGRNGIRVNVVSPGTVRTPETETQGKNFQERAAAAALKRLAAPEEVVKTYLAFMENSGLTGQELVIDCGQSLNPSQSLFDQYRTGKASQPAKPGW